MKKIDLGNNVKVEVTAEGFKIISASGSEILLDCTGEFLTYTNQVGLKQAKERKEFFEKFIKMDKGKKEAVFDWLRSCDGHNNEMKQNFFFNLGQAMAEAENDYYIIEVSDSNELINLMNEYQKVLPSYSLKEATRSEEILWVAYNIAKEYWTFEEGLFYNRRKNKTLYVLKK